MKNLSCESISLALLVDSNSVLHQVNVFFASILLKIILEMRDCIKDDYALDQLLIQQLHK